MGYGIFKYLFWPLGLIYGSIVELIKWGYRQGFWKRQRFERASLVVGNLSMGGTGKSPHVEYILKQMGSYHHLAVLSRGYGRKTKGLRWLSLQSTAEEVGDEPLQIHQKFPNIPFVVAEKRTEGMQAILQKAPITELVVLDDAMQHWPLIADAYLLLTTYQQPFFKDAPLPAGRLREFAFNYKRAKIIVVSKCPANLSKEVAQAFLKKINPLPHQKVFFSYFRYGQTYLLNAAMEKQELLSWKEQPILLLTGIAKPAPLVQYLEQKGLDINLMAFNDHHLYTTKDWTNIQQKLKQLGPNAILLTTEKDSIRLASWAKEFPIYVIPIEVEIAFGQAAAFQRAIIEVIYRKKGYPST